MHAIKTPPRDRQKPTTTPAPQQDQRIAEARLDPKIELESEAPVAARGEVKKAVDNFYRTRDRYERAAIRRLPSDDGRRPYCGSQRAMFDAAAFAAPDLINALFAAGVSDRAVRCFLNWSNARHIDHALHVVLEDRVLYAPPRKDDEPGCYPRRSARLMCELNDCIERYIEQARPKNRWLERIKAIWSMIPIVPIVNAAIRALLKPPLP